LRPIQNYTQNPIYGTDSKKANRFSDDEPEVIASADSRSEAEALAHDYQVNFYRESAFITFRKAGDNSTNSEPPIANPELRIAYYDMTIEGLDGKFLVAKLRRVSSPPVQVGTVSDSMASALGRLVDIIRLGRESRNYVNLKAIERLLKEQGMVDAETEWAKYEKVVCQSLGMERLKPLQSLRCPLIKGLLRFVTSMIMSGRNRHSSDLQVTFHKAEMNDLPYLVARVGEIMGSPAPVYMTLGYERESALARLHDVFKIGKQGQAFQDFVEAGRKQGKREGEIVEEWREGEAWFGNEK